MGEGAGHQGAELTIIEQEMRHREREETYRTHIQSAKAVLSIPELVAVFPAVVSSPDEGEVEGSVAASCFS